MLRMVLVSCREGFGVVQSMLMPTHLIQTISTYLVVGVQTCHLDHYTSCGVANVHDKFQGSTVDVQATTWFLIFSTLPCCRCTNLPLGPLHFMQ